MNNMTTKQGRLSKQDKLLSIVFEGKSFCMICKQYLCIAVFGRTPAGNLRNVCEACRVASLKAANERYAKNRLARENIEEIRSKIVDKRCPRCQETKSTTEFWTCKIKKDGYNLYCKACVIAAWPSRIYGMSNEEYNALLNSQEYCCAICAGRLKPGRTTCVDHDHKTNKVRALLCNKCNIQLGHAEPVLQGILETGSHPMIDYLRLHNAQTD